MRVSLCASCLDSIQLCWLELIVGWFMCSGNPAPFRSILIMISRGVVLWLNCDVHPSNTFYYIHNQKQSLAVICQIICVCDNYCWPNNNGCFPDSIRDLSTGHFSLYLKKQNCSRFFITVMSKWVWWHLKSPAPLLFAEPFVQVEIKENIKALRHWPNW